MNEILHQSGVFQADGIALFWNLVANGIHDDAGMISIDQHQIGKVSFPPCPSIAVCMSAIYLIEET